MIGFAVLAFTAALLVIASFVARALAARALGVRGSTWWFFTAPFRWETRGPARWTGIVAASALSSYLVVALLATAGIVLSGTDRTDLTSMRVQVDPNGPAAMAGVHDGDRVVAVDAVAVNDWDALKREIHEHAAQPVTLTIQRGGETLRIEVTPNDAGKIMIGPEVAIEQVPIGVAAREGLMLPPRVWFATARGIVRAMSGQERAEVTGPVGIVREAERTAQSRGVGRALEFAGALTAYGFPFLVLYAMLVTPFRSARR
jgi:regulator of sigma E protease